MRREPCFSAFERNSALGTMRSCGGRDQNYLRERPSAMLRRRHGAALVAHGSTKIASKDDSGRYSASWPSVGQTSLDVSGAKRAAAVEHRIGPVRASAARCSILAVALAASAAGGLSAQSSPANRP